MPEPCNVGFLFVSSVAGQGIQNHTENLKKNSFFLNIILSCVLHGCLGLIEIYEYENKQKSSFWCYDTVTSPLRSILSFTCNFWFYPVVWMKPCSAVCRPRQNTFLGTWGAVGWLQGRLSYRPICCCSPLPGPPLHCLELTKLHCTNLGC